MSHINFAEGSSRQRTTNGSFPHQLCHVPDTHGNKVPSKTWLSSTFAHCWIPEKKSKVNRARETNLKNKNLCSPFFWWNFLLQTFQDLHESPWVFQDPCGLVLVNHYVSAPRRPRRPRYTFGMLYGKPLILQQTLTPPQGMSSPISGEWTIARIQTLKSFTPQHFSITLFWRNMR